MSKGYEQFFKDAKKNKKKNTNDADSAIRAALQMTNKKKDKKNKPVVQWATLTGLTVMLGLAGTGYIYVDNIANFVSRIEISTITGAFAQEKDTPSKEEKSAESASETLAGVDKKCEYPTQWNDEELSHLKTLSERKMELDQREQELNILEEELHKQKGEIEVRVQDLANIRREIGSVLKDRVEVDEGRIKTLVDFYSNMKPKQAAEVFGALNEDLAIEILGRMKKKNAAEIMNMLEPKKARVLTEKYTGYKRR